MSLEKKVLQALEYRPLSQDELMNSLENPDVQDLQSALYQLREQKMWIEKHPIVGGGCKDCACQVTFKWRLTLAGRQQLTLG